MERAGFGTHAALLSGSSFSVGIGYGAMGANFKYFSFRFLLFHC